MDIVFEGCSFAQFDLSLSVLCFSVCVVALECCTVVFLTHFNKYL